jgi:hypothetical protein
MQEENPCFTIGLSPSAFIAERQSSKQPQLWRTGSRLVPRPVARYCEISWCVDSAPDFSREWQDGRGALTQLSSNLDMCRWRTGGSKLIHRRWRLICYCMKLSTKVCMCMETLARAYSPSSHPVTAVRCESGHSRNGGCATWDPMIGHVPEIQDLTAQCLWPVRKKADQPKTSNFIAGLPLPQLKIVLTPSIPSTYQPDIFPLSSQSSMPCDSL